MSEVVVCQTGMGRHDPELRAKVERAGARLDTVECFDKCEVRERFLIARVDGATVRFRDSAELLDALAALNA